MNNMIPEHQNIEYKSSWHDDYLKWICGFANAQGGKIYIGKDDEGNIVGVENYKDLIVEMMYEGVVNGNNGMREVRVE